jgi:hypothetical protein
MAVMELKGPVRLSKKHTNLFDCEHKPAIAFVNFVVVNGTAVASVELWELYRFEISQCSRSESDVHLASVPRTAAGREVGATHN